MFYGPHICGEAVDMCGKSLKILKYNAPVFFRLYLNFYSIVILSLSLWMKKCLVLHGRLYYIMTMNIVDCHNTPSLSSSRDTIKHNRTKPYKKEDKTQQSRTQISIDPGLKFLNICTLHTSIKYPTLSHTPTPP